MAIACNALMHRGHSPSWLAPPAVAKSPLTRPSPPKQTSRPLLRMGIACHSSGHGVSMSGFLLSSILYDRLVVRWVGLNAPAVALCMCRHTARGDKDAPYPTIL